MDLFFGHQIKTLQIIQKESFLGCLKINVVDPPEGSVWGHFNDRAVNQAWVIGLLKSFQDEIGNCDNKFRMDIVVKRSWVDNLKEAEQYPDVTGMRITELPELKLTDTGKQEILEEELWFMGGNHRRLALIWYVGLLKNELQKLEEQLAAEDVSMGRTSALATFADASGTASTSAPTQMTPLQLEVRNKKQQIEESCMWMVGLYDRGAQINPIHHPSMDDLTLHPWPDKVNSYGEDLSYATFRLMSRNEVHGTYKATEEEYLLEIIDQIKIALLKDLRDMRNRPPAIDYHNSCPEYNKAVARTADKYRKVNSGFRKIVLVPSLVLALVMASRVRKHFIHSSWFRTNSLMKMIDVHAGVCFHPSHPRLISHLTGAPSS